MKAVYIDCMPGARAETPGSRLGDWGTRQFLVGSGRTLRLALLVGLVAGLAVCAGPVSASSWHPSGTVIGFADIGRGVAFPGGGAVVPYVESTLGVPTLGVLVRRSGAVTWTKTRLSGVERGGPGKWGPHPVAHVSADGRPSVIWQRFVNGRFGLWGRTRTRGVWAPARRIADLGRGAVEGRVIYEGVGPSGQSVLIASSDIGGGGHWSMFALTRARGSRVWYRSRALATGTGIAPANGGDLRISRGPGGEVSLAWLESGSPCSLRVISLSRSGWSTIDRLTPPGFCDTLFSSAYAKDGTLLAVWSRRTRLSPPFVSNDQQVLVATRPAGSAVWSDPRQVSTIAPNQPPAVTALDGQIIVVYGEDSASTFPFARVLTFALPISGGGPTVQVVAPRVRNPGPVRLEALADGRTMALWARDQSGLGVAIRSTAGEWGQTIDFASGLDLFDFESSLVGVGPDGWVLAVGQPSITEPSPTYAYELTSAGVAVPRVTLCRRCVLLPLVVSSDETWALWRTQKSQQQLTYRIAGAWFK